MAEEQQKRKRGRPTKEATEARKRAEYEALKAEFDAPEAKGKALPSMKQKGRVMVTVDPGEASRYTQVFMQQSGLLDYDSNELPEVTEKRMLFINYMESCVQYDIIPANQGCFSALHVSPEEWRKTVAGQINPQFRVLYTQIERVLSAIREQLGMKSKINPATLIFWGKNFDGMKDEQEVLVANKDQFGELPDGQKLAEKYMNLPDK